MDDRDKNALGGAVTGAAVGAAGGPGGAAAGFFLGLLIGGSETDHNETLRETFYNVQDAAGDNAHLYVDHIKPTGRKAKSPGSVVSAVNGTPDLVLVDTTSANLVVEVETAAGIKDDPAHAIEQLNDFYVQGFKRVLVVPESEVDGIFEWVEKHEDAGNIEHEVKIATPESIEALL